MIFYLLIIIKNVPKLSSGALRLKKALLISVYWQRGIRQVQFPSVTALAMYSLPNRNGHVQSDATFHEGEKETDCCRIL
jgi:hypothetical protein